MRKLAEITLPIDSHTLDQALAWLEETGRQQAWPARTVFKLRLCLDEILTNLAMHGFPDGHAATRPRVQLQLQQEDQHLVLEILDNGVAFDPTARRPRALDASLDEAQIGGHGLRLLRHYLQDIRYERREDWNRLELVAALDHA